MAVLANPRVAADRVRPLVPEEFAITVGLDGITPIELQAVRCERIEVKGVVVQDASWLAARVPLSSDPEGVRVDLNDEPVFHFNTYMLWLASDSRELVDLLRHDGGAAHRAVYAPQLGFMPTSTGGELHFDAPPPTPSPLHVRARVTDQLLFTASRDPSALDRRPRRLDAHR